MGCFNGQGLGADYEEAVKRMRVAGGGPTDSAAAVDDSPHSLPSSSSSAASLVQGQQQPTLPQRRKRGGVPALPSSRPSSDVQVQLRVTAGSEYIKLVLLRGRVVGALLIGDTGLEETLENRMLSGTRVGAAAPRSPLPATSAGGGGVGGHPSLQPQQQLLDLLHADMDVEDYFD